jgi:Sec-independent protein translocase protein TatA
VSVLLTNIWLLLGSITLGGVLKIPKALSHAGRIVSAARTLLRSSQTLMGRVRDAQKRSALEKEQHAAQKSIEKMQTQVKEAAPKNLTHGHL